MWLVLFSDIHLGNKSNSEDFNKQCLEFLKYMIDYSDKNIKDYSFVFMGDYFHNRSTVNSLTLHYGVQGLKLLKESNAKKIYLLAGNHDMYYSDRLDVTSLGSIVENIVRDKIKLVNKPLKENNLLFLPWLVNDEKVSNLIKEYEPEYIFGHLEIPSFKLNSFSIMKGDYDVSEYVGPKKIFSGHFHSKSEKDNILYIGNCFSQDYSDANDWENKGFTVFNTETGEIKQVVWENAPKYVTSYISKLKDLDIPNNSYLKITDDVGLTTEQLNKIKEMFKTQSDIKEFLIIPKDLNIENIETGVIEEKISDINILLTELLTKVEIDGINNETLIEIYKELDYE